MLLVHHKTDENEQDYVLVLLEVAINFAMVVEVTLRMMALGKTYFHSKVN